MSEKERFGSFRFLQVGVSPRLLRMLGTYSGGMLAGVRSVLLLLLLVLVPSINNCNPVGNENSGRKTACARLCVYLKTSQSD